MSFPTDSNPVYIYPQFIPKEERPAAKLWFRTTTAAAQHLGVKRKTFSDAKANNHNVYDKDGRAWKVRSAPMEEPICTYERKIVSAIPLNKKNSEILAKILKDNDSK